MTGFKLNFESQFDMQYLASILAYTGAVAGIHNDQDLTKYLINDCSSFRIIRVCVLVYGLQTALSLAQSVPWVQKISSG